MSEDCPFCSIASGEAPASIVYEDESVLAFMDLNPVNMGHTLVIPREHCENMFEIPEETLTKVIAVVKRLCAALKETVDAEGLKVIQLNGKAAGQVVFHLHFHIIPYSSKSDVRRVYHGRVTSKRAELDEIAQRIRENM
jgi:histidine triad (HIT) family protein